MKIALCDDVLSENENLKSYIESFADTNNLDLCAESFTSGEELLKREKFDLYFLDYVMPGMNGLELALELEKRFGNNLNICYLTSYENAAVDIINSDIKPLGFIRKPISVPDIDKIFEKLNKKSFFSNIVLKKDGVSYVIPVKDIVYAEALSKGTVIRCFDKTYEFRYKFNEFVEEYFPKKGFFKIHRSFVINLSHVSTFSRKEVIMKNGDSVPVSRKVDIESAFFGSVFESEF